MGVIDFLHHIMLSRLLSADLSLTFACPRNRLSNSRTQHSPTLSCCTSALSFDNLQGLTYLQIKGSGLANTCQCLRAPQMYDSYQLAIIHLTNSAWNQLLLKLRMKLSSKMV